MKRVAVLGAGAWGTSIALALAGRLDVSLWARDAAQAQAIARTRRNERYLPGIELPAALAVSAQLPAADLYLAATPVAGLRGVLKDLKSPVVWLCKGFERGSGMLPHQIAEQALGAGARCGALSGPSFAEEVARGLPCALTLASRDAQFAREAAALLHGGRIRVYYSADLVGVEIGGAVKNVMAIAAGISDGLGLGYNARAALITRGLAEIARLGAAMGGEVRVGALSGPSFAAEVARGLPCALTLASKDAGFAREAAATLHGGRMRVYYSTDLVGVEVGGAVKNVMAIAAGISDGLGLGLNARAALITRGLAEMARLGAALGGSAETLFGLAGAGDLILTATGELSRNRRVGLQLAQGRPLEEILAHLGHVAEGVRSAKEVARLAKAKGVDMPVSDAVNAVLAGTLTPAHAVERLLARDAKKEH